MIQPDYSKDDLQSIRDTAEELSKMDTVFYSGHCTGEEPYRVMKEIMGDKLQAISGL